MSDFHRISDLNTEARTATCSVCGPVRVKIRLKKNNHQAVTCWTQESKYRKNLPSRKTRYKKNLQAGRNRYFRGVEGYTETSKEELWELQGKCCDSCGKDITLEESRQDHCHSRMILRGILCNNCNRGLGLLGDNVESLKRAVAYLEKYA